jgi:copper chaperone CopZ
MRVKVYVPDIECDSCVKILKKGFKHLQGIEDYHFGEDFMVINYDESLIKVENIISAINGMGYRASTKPFDRKSLKQRLRHVKENRNKYSTELNVVKYTFALFGVLLLFELMAYYGFLSDIPNFLSNYGWWIFYINVSIASLGAAIWHYFSYKAKVTCMVGMMVGMTLGMQSGLMIGAIIGATNGFFMGSMVGMIVGVTIGAYCGKDCGVMGIMEGMMAGLMGGTMGPMISIMMFADHLLWFMPLYMLVNIIILWGFSYMFYEEVVEGKEVEKRKIDFSTLASFSVVATFVLMYIMIYGLKSALVSF